MFEGIRSISSVNAFSGAVDNIILDGRNLIVTGGNGCGKTRFLTKIYETLFSRVAERSYKTDSDLANEISNAERQIPLSAMGSQNWSHYTFILPQLIEERERRERFNIIFDSNGQELFTASYHTGKSVLMHFPAFRTSTIKAADSVRSLELIKSSTKDIITHAHQLGSPKATYFEEYLVALKQARALYITEDGDHISANKIEEWFEKLERDLGELFEDKSLQLNFKVRSASFEIVQNNKEPYKFQNLSSGFSAVMCIYAELLMSIEVNELSPQELRGVVFIDEIDAHLHISIQKKIMSFLTKSFPSIQFIVTTHSPFVVMSVNDAVIYDLSKHEQVNDLSLYSYEAVAEGLFNTSSISQVLIEKMHRLNTLANDIKNNKSEVVNIISMLRQHEDKLDEESKFYLKTAEITLMKHYEGGEGV